MSITIKNLTAAQVKLIDKIWSCKTEDELREWLKTLPRDVVDEVSVLIKLIQIELIDSDLESKEDLSVAKSALKKFTLKG